MVLKLASSPLIYPKKGDDQWTQTWLEYLSNTRSSKELARGLLDCQVKIGDMDQHCFVQDLASRSIILKESYIMMT